MPWAIAQHLAALAAAPVAGLTWADQVTACEAIAAAAILAAQQPGGQPIASPYAPEFLRDGGRLDVPDDLAALALKAIDRILAADSEWRELWEDADADGAADAVDALRDLRKVLAA